MLNQKEKEFIVNLLSKVNVPAADPESVGTIQTIQSILQKLLAQEEVVGSSGDKA